MIVITKQPENIQKINLALTFANDLSNLKRDKESTLNYPPGK